MKGFELMAYVAHTPVKPEQLAATAVSLVERELVVPTLFTRKGIEEYKGAKDDTVNMVVPGVLPAHDYAWRNDRSTALTVDQYTERKIAVRFGGNAYSATELTDEQKEFDFGDWGKLLLAQGRAVARKLEQEAVKHLTSATYSVTLGAKAKNLLNDIVEARRVLNRMGAAKEGRILLVGSEIETILQTNEVFNRALNIGDESAASALHDATLGKVKGFTVIVSEDIPVDEAYALTPGAFAFLNAAPLVPTSIKDGSTATGKGGIALRWMKDYDSLHLVERSIVNTWYGFQQVKDPVVYWDTATNREVVSAEEYMVRAVKIKLDGTDTFFSGSGDGKKVRDALGLATRSKATTAAA